jgi:hypothetical protein
MNIFFQTTCKTLKDEIIFLHSWNIYSNPHKLYFESITLLYPVNILSDSYLNNFRYKYHKKEKRK